MSETPQSSSADPSLVVGNQADDLGFDRARLNEITQTALQPGVLFGRGLELTEHDREQFTQIASMVEAELEPHYKDPNWGKFMALVDEGDQKGLLHSFTTQEGTNVPLWCVNGGDDPEVKKIRRRTDRGEEPAIQVPAGIFLLYHWHNTVKNLKKYTVLSNELIRGRSTRFLGEDLRQLAAFVQQLDSKEIPQIGG